MHALTAITALPIGGSSLAAVATAGGSSSWPRLSGGVAATTAGVSLPRVFRRRVLRAARLIHSRWTARRSARRRCCAAASSTTASRGRRLGQGRPPAARLPVARGLQPLYPLLELVLRPFDLAAFYFYYPRANGAGLVIDSLARQRAGLRGTKAQVFRLDWHASSSTSASGARRPTPGATSRASAATCRTSTCRSATCATGWRQHLNDWVAATHEPSCRRTSSDPTRSPIPQAEEAAPSQLRARRAGSEQARARVA